MNLVYQTTTHGSVEDVGARLEQAVQDHAFSVLNVVDLKAKMNSKGVDFGPACRIYEICNPHRAKEVLESDLRISTALPCRISVYEEHGQITLSTLLPTATLRMFDKPELDPLAAAVEHDIKAMMDQAAQA